MKPEVSDKKKKRQIISFEPDLDVNHMLKKAQMAGLAITEILNQALKDCGEKVIKELATKKANDLTSLSFDQPDLPLGGFAEAA